MDGWTDGLTDGLIVLYFVFIHFHNASRSMSLSEALPTTALTLCRSLHDEALQATVSKVLAQGPYVAARAGFEPATLLSKDIDSTNAPPRPTNGRIDR